MSARQSSHESWHGGLGYEVPGCELAWWYAPRGTSLTGALLDLHRAQGANGSTFTAAALYVTDASHFHVQPGEEVTVAVSACRPALPLTVIGQEIKVRTGGWLHRHEDGKPLRTLAWKRA